MTKHTARVRWTGDVREGEGRVEAAKGAFSALGRLKARAEGGIGGETTPEELIAGAHALCFAMSVEGALAKERFAVEALEVEATISLERSANGFKLTESALKVRGHGPQKGLEAGRFRELVQRAEASCPVSNALRNNVAIRVEAELG